MTEAKNEPMSSLEIRRNTIRRLATEVGGYEESIRLAMEERDWDIVEALKPLKVSAYQRLKRYIQYGKTD